MLSLYMAFNTRTGEVLGNAAAQHTCAEFVAILPDIVANEPCGKKIPRDRRQPFDPPEPGRYRTFLESHPKVPLILLRPTTHGFLSFGLILIHNNRYRTFAASDVRVERDDGSGLDREQSR